MSIDRIHPCVPDNVFEGFYNRVVQSNSEACRLFHGRGRSFPALEFLTIDYYPPVLFILLHDDPGDGWIQALVMRFLRYGEEYLACIVVQRRYLSIAENEVWWGEMPSSIKAVESGLSYQIRFDQNQNIGFFLDMKYSRQWLKERAKGKNILNLFAYTCAFSVVSNEAGAEQVVNIDMSSGALGVGRKNHRMNQQSLQNVKFFAHDIFRSWAKLRRHGPYDIIVIDPPMRQHGHFVVEKDYARILRRMPSLLSNNGDILACLHTPYLGYEFLEKSMEETLPGFLAIQCVRLPEEFPEIEPERGVKMIHFHCI